MKSLELYWNKQIGVINRPQYQGKNILGNFAISVQGFSVKSYHKMKILSKTYVNLERSNLTASLVQVYLNTQCITPAFQGFLSKNDSD